MKLNIQGILTYLGDDDRRHSFLLSYMTGCGELLDVRVLLLQIDDEMRYSKNRSGLVYMLVRK